MLLGVQPVNNKNKCQLPVPKDTSQTPNKIEKNLTVLAPKNEFTQLLNQTDQANDSISDSDKFGFIPLQNQILPNKDHINPSMPDVLKTHKIISNSGTYNFLDCQIEVPSQLNADVWEKYLDKYWDSQLKFLIR